MNSSGRDVVVISSGRDMVVINSCMEMGVISSGREMVVISSGMDVVVISSSKLGFSSNRNMVTISGRDNRGRGRANGEAPGTSPPPGVGTYTTVYRADSVH